MVFAINDPITVVQSILGMILNITETVYDTVEYSMDYNGEMSSTAKDNLNLCSLYIDQGFINIASGFLCAYGAAAAETPQFRLKGSGDIVLKADKEKEFYVTKKLSGGSPAGAIHETLDTVKFGIGAVTAVGDLTKSFISAVNASNAVRNPEEEKEELI
jgi:hypothetical protein